MKCKKQIRESLVEHLCAQLMSKLRDTMREGLSDPDVMAVRAHVFAEEDDFDIKVVEDALVSCANQLIQNREAWVD